MSNLCTQCRLNPCRIGQRNCLVCHKAAQRTYRQKIAALVATARAKEIPSNNAGGRHETVDQQIFSSASTHGGQHRKVLVAEVAA